METVKKIRIDQLNFTRFLAAISIVIFHFGTAATPFHGNSLSFLFERANIAVSYFFVLSGFVMILSSSGKRNISFFPFIKRRLARLYPIYVLALLLTIGLLIDLQEISWNNFFLNLFLIQSWFPNKALTLNYPGWSLSNEMFFYALFPFLLSSLYRRLRPWIVTVVVVLFWISSQVLFQFLVIEYSWMVKYWHYIPILHLNEFLLGSLAGLYFLQKKDGMKKNKALWIFFLLFLLVLALKLSVDYHNGLLAPLFAIFLVVLSLDNGWVSRFSQNKLCVFLGDISYSVYILQFPVWLLISDYRLEKYLGVSKGTDLAFYVKLFFLLLISSIAYVMIEVPVREFFIKGRGYKLLMLQSKNRKLRNISEI